MLRPGFVVPDSIVGRGVRGELGGLDEQGKLCPEGEAALYNGVLAVRSITPEPAISDALKA